MKQANKKIFYMISVIMILLIPKFTFGFFLYGKENIGAALFSVFIIFSIAFILLLLPLLSAVSAVKKIKDKERNYPFGFYTLSLIALEIFLTFLYSFAGAVTYTFFVAFFTLLITSLLILSFVKKFNSQVTLFQKILVILASLIQWFYLLFQISYFTSML